MTFTVFSPGDIIRSTEHNDNFSVVYNEFKQIYTGTGFNSEVSAVGTNENSFEMNDILSADLVGDYVIINCTFTAYIQAPSSNGTHNVYYKIQTKDIGGAYSDTLPYKTVLGGVTTTTTGTGQTITTTIQHYHTLTVDEKANGITIKLFSKSEAIGDHKIVNFTNIQSTITLK